MSKETCIIPSQDYTIDFWEQNIFLKKMGLTPVQNSCTKIYLCGVLSCHRNLHWLLIHTYRGNRSGERKKGKGKIKRIAKEWGRRRWQLTNERNEKSRQRANREGGKVKLKAEAGSADQNWSEESTVREL